MSAHARNPHLLPPLRPPTLLQVPQQDLGVCGSPRPPTPAWPLYGQEDDGNGFCGAGDTGTSGVSAFSLPSIGVTMSSRRLNPHGTGSISSAQVVGKSGAFQVGARGHQGDGGGGGQGAADQSRPGA